MYPYQVYKVLADQHIRDLTTDARGHGRMRATQPADMDPTDRSSRVRDAVAHLAALARVPRAAAARNAQAASTAPPTRVSATTASPLGCSA
jgi:hypothetical protein